VSRDLEDQLDAAVAAGDREDAKRVASGQATVADVLEGRAPWCVVQDDAAQVLPRLPADGFVLTDPPYGIDLDTDYGGKMIGGNKHDRVLNDDRPFDPSPLLRFKRAILWGANNYASRLPDDGRWLCWDKVTRNDLNMRIAEMELAWTNCINRPRVFRHLWSGAYRDSEQRTAYHPCQKPVALMLWCLNLVPDAGLILDPYAGSGTVGVAAIRLGRRYIGVELDERYVAVARERLSAERASSTLEASRAGQGALFGDH
jgi:DNA modification methylase